MYIDKIKKNFNIPDRSSFWYLTELLAILFVVDIFLIKGIYAVLIWTFLLVWAITVRVYRIKPHLLAYAGIGMLTLMPVAFAVGAEAVAEKAASWAFIFFIVALLQYSITYFKSKQ